ncbi:antibiotic biosynthesis monooxygenase [Leptospira selangorensis]|uniref:Antibiotic biosynthesis monooxygenase n=1 Tax=Leptospira selangorensis TaxID=2484982 RepID=A0A5F2C3U0_9LEPT|nr:antibiotic biosynthesis monooxygenase [Leptospira selangorensis]TGM11237.1 antibiotic biosynthesis monooxygenase [Leptospira selangorensis]TGM23010.1 antibiotic biosynthesis monooxygenase [Leptospira selangorensis]
MQKVLIDTFIVPKKSKLEFFNRVKVNRNFIKNLPGFVQDSSYIREKSSNEIQFVTVAIWEDEEAISNAKKEVQASYQKEGFDMPGMLERLGISIERGIFDVSKS